MSRPFSLRAALAFAAFACATISFSQSPTTPSPSAPPEPHQAAPAAPPTPDAQQTVSAGQPAVEARQTVPTAQPSDPAQTPASEPSRQGEKADAPTAAEIHEAAEIEDQLSQQLEGKTFYLRGGYQDNTLHFNQKGELDGNSPKASYALSLVEINRVKVDKRHVELEGVRYGLHFLGALATEDQAANVDRVKLTSKKRPLKITIDRELVVTPKKEKPAKVDKKNANEKKPALKAKAPAQVATTAAAQPALTSPSTQATDTLPSAPTPQMDTAAQPTAAAPTRPTGTTPPATAPPTVAITQPQAATAASPVASAADTTRHGEAVTTSPAEAARMLRTALDRVFSSGIDDQMVATLPDYWKLYYKAVNEKADYRPSDPAVLRSNQVDKKPRLTMAFEPPSNEYAQNNGVAGMAMYHVIVGPDGKPREIAVGRPIGFGLDENAVDAIRKASFEPGMKDGKPVAVEVDLTVQFRIFSKRTAAGSTDAAKAEPAAPKAPEAILPGPYSVNHP
jgi:TonB family protein